MGHPIGEGGSWDFVLGICEECNVILEWILLPWALDHNFVCDLCGWFVRLSKFP